MKKYTIITRPDEDSLQLEKKLHKILETHDHILDSSNPEIVFVIGGDGTFIYAVHHYLNQLENVYFYGIHTGTLGFYSDFKDSLKMLNLILHKFHFCEFIVKPF